MHGLHVQIVSASTQVVLARPSTQFTVLLPPPPLLDALLAAYRAGDVDADTARSTLLMHIIPQRLRTADIRALGSGAAVATLSKHATLKVRLLGPTTVEFTHGGARAAVTAADLPACSTLSVLHEVDTLLTSTALPLPESFAKAGAGGSLAGGRAGDTNSDNDSGPTAGFVVGIVLACLAVVLALLALVIFLRKRQAARLRRAAKTKDPVPRITTNCDRPALLPLGMRLPPRSDATGRDASTTMSHSWNPVATLSEFADDDDEDEPDGLAATMLRVPGAIGAPHVPSLAGAAAGSLSVATGDPSTSSQAALRSSATMFSTSGTTPGSSTEPTRAASDVPPPPPGARAEERRQWLCHQLDCIGSAPLLQRFVLLGPTERRHSGMDSPPPLPPSPPPGPVTAPTARVRACVNGQHRSLTD